MSDIVEALQQSDSDCRDRDCEGERSPAGQRQGKQERHFESDIAKHPLVPPVRIELPRFPELADDGPAQEGIQTFAQSRRCRVVMSAATSSGDSGESAPSRATKFSKAQIEENIAQIPIKAGATFVFHSHRCLLTRDRRYLPLAST